MQAPIQFIRLVEQSLYQIQVRPKTVSSVGGTYCHKWHYAVANLVKEPNVLERYAYELLKSQPRWLAEEVHLSETALHMRRHIYICDLNEPLVESLRCHYRESAVERAKYSFDLHA